MRILKKHLLHIIFIIAALHLNTLANAADESSPILVAMGGFGSCNNNSDASQWNLLSYLRGSLSQRVGQKALSFPWIATCYEDGPQI